MSKGYGPMPDFYYLFMGGAARLDFENATQALGALHQAEIAKWWPIIKAAGITAE